MRKLFISVMLLLIVSGILVFGCSSRDAGRKVDAPYSSDTAAEKTPTGEGSQGMNTDNIILGGGCFWCTEAVFSMVKGITDTTVGYAGGRTVNPNYKEVCNGTTGHAEVVRVTYDPGRITLEKLLELFFASHDPTSLNRQGADTGTQYRSTILYTSDEQKAVIDEYLKKALAEYENPIVTEVAELGAFYTAEDYHQDYFEKNPDAPYCSSVISPKVKKVKEML